jgi:hypothetical protein
LHGSEWAPATLTKVAAEKDAQLSSQSEVPAGLSSAADERAASALVGQECKEKEERVTFGLIMLAWSLILHGQVVPSLANQKADPALSC